MAWDFDQTFQWVNSPPLSFEKELKGKIVVLDFWTYCCINCLHVLPELEQLEKKYAGAPIVFIGIHSAKFSNERLKENVEAAVSRLDIHHPVVVDPKMKLWRHFNVQAWPTLVVLGPEGKWLESFSGEGNGEKVDQLLAKALKRYESHLDSTPLPVLEEKAAPQVLLSFPGKVALNVEGDLLCISDTAHHRLLLCTPEGRILDQIGTGDKGFSDGVASQACFNQPQGVVWRGQTLYVADTGNHALREVDLASKQVKTLAGTGERGLDRKGGQGRGQPLASPWDLCLVQEHLFIAMAGTHQIWVYDLERGMARAFSGTGAELLLDSEEATSAAWAQPSGLSFGEEKLFVADSESSSIRGIDFLTGRTFTLVGGDWQNPRNLFAYGDRDGVGPHALLQHPLAVCWDAQRHTLYVADTYNHKIKRLDPETKAISTWLTGFAEPSGLAISPDGTWLYVADTNHHRICKIHIETSKIETLNLVWN